MNTISIFSTIISFIFATAVLRRWQTKKSNYTLLWGIGLIIYGIATLTEVVLSVAFGVWALKVWYLAGAMLTAAWLGQGTIYLLVRRKGAANALMIVLGIASLAALASLLIAPVTTAASSYDISRPASEQYREIIVRSGGTIVLTILLNIYGTLTLVGGAIYSAFLFWRKKVLFNRMMGNILIAAGAMVPAMGGSFVKMGLVDWLYISEFVGVVLMYAGFVLATASKPIERPVVETFVAD
jgi:hypothetical protein